MKKWLNKYQDAGEVIYVDDPNDPRLLDYQTRLNLYKYSQIPNTYHLDRLSLDQILSGVYDQENLTKNAIADKYIPTAYDTDIYGPYGSRNEIRNIAINELDTFRNNPELSRRADIDSSFYGAEGRDILKKYPPIGYRGRYEYTDRPYQDVYQNRGDQFFGTNKYMIEPKTQFLEDTIDRELLRKTYPNLTDELIDEYVRGERENPTYFTNVWDDDPRYNWYQRTSVDSPTITPDIVSSTTNVIDTVDGLYPKTHDILYHKTGEYDLNRNWKYRKAKGYLQEGVTHDIDRYGTYYPVWDAPTQKVEFRKPQPKPDSAIIQVGDSPYEKGSRQSSKAVQDKYPGMGTHEYADQVRIGTDLYPVTHTGDKPYGEFEVDGKKQYIIYEKNSEGSYSPVISETKPAAPKVVKAPTFKSGGWLDQYQVGSQVKTYASDPNYFDNRAVFVDNPKANDLVRSKVYAGTHGWDPTTNSLVKLDKPVAVPEAVREMSTADYGKKSHKERFESETPAGKATRKAVVAKEMNKAVTNPGFRGAIPAMMLPGLPALGEAVYTGVMSTPLGSATAGALGSSLAPGLTYGTLGQGLVDSYFAAKAPNQLMNANLDFKSGKQISGITNLASATMGLLPFTKFIPNRAPGPLMILDDSSKGVSKAKGDEPHLSEWQKLRIAEGKPVYIGSGKKGNMTMGEMSAKKQLNKSIDAREKPKKVKKLTKEQEYEKLLRESYQRSGGQIRYQDGGNYDRIPQSWKDKYDWTPNVEEEYQMFKNDPNAPENLRFTDDMKDYNTRGMWDSLDRPSNWQQALDLFRQQQGYEWTPEDDGYYHAWSQHPGTGEWLKPKHHSTGWMNYIGYAFDPNTTAVVNPEGFFGNDTLQAYPRKKKGGVKSSAEGYYDYINGYSGIFAKGGTKGWLDNYK